MQRNKTNTLSDLELDEVSLVDTRPANQHAHVVLAKRGDGSINRETDKGGLNMNPKELAIQLEAREAEVSGLTKRAEEAEANLATANGAVEALTKQAKEAGLVVTKAEDGTVTLAKAEDPEYVDIDGEKVEKSLVPEPVLKRMQAQDEAIAKMQEDRETEKLEKRADDELPHMAGTASERAALIKAVDAIKDETVRDSVFKSLKAADAAVSKAFEETGHTTIDESSPQGQLEAMAKAYKDENDVSFEQAFAEVTKSGEGAKLMAATRSNQH